MDPSAVALLDSRKMTLDAVTPRTVTLVATAPPRLEDATVSGVGWLRVRMETAYCAA